MYTHALGQLTARVENDGVRLACFLTTPAFEARRNQQAPLMLRVYRKRMPGFRFGRHYAEYFDGLADEPALLAQVGIAVLPNVNIDERERLIAGCPWYLRTNSRGVDINRNFDANWKTAEFDYGYDSRDPDALTYRGPKPASEPETRAVVRFLKTTQPRAVLAFHSLASITGACLLAARSAEADPRYVRTCTNLAQSFVRGFYGQNMRWQAGMHFGTSAGSLPEYAYRKLGIPGFDLEWDGNPDAKPALSDNTSLSMLATFQRCHDHGLVSILKNQHKMLAC